MPCITCAETVVGIFIRETVNVHLIRGTSAIVRTPGLLQKLPFPRRARVQFSLFQSRRYASRPQDPADDISVDDLYIPFDARPSANHSLPHPLNSILPSRRHTLTQHDSTHLRSRLEVELQLHQNNGRSVSEEPKDASVAYRELEKGDLQQLSNPVRIDVEKPDYDDVILELSPDNIDVIADEIAKVEGSSSLLPRSIDRTVGRLDAANSARGEVADTATFATTVKDGAVGASNRLGRNTEQWQVQKAALEDKFGSDGWKPRKRLSPDALEGIRALNAQYPEKYTTPILADQFKVSPEAIRRILSSKWRPNETEIEERRQRWDKRGERIWSKMVELGLKPPKKWREMGIGRKEGSSARERPRSRIGGRQELGSSRPPWGNQRAGVDLAKSKYGVDWEEETFARRIL